MRKKINLSCIFHPWYSLYIISVYISFLLIILRGLISLPWEIYFKGESFPRHAVGLGFNSVSDSVYVGAEVMGRHFCVIVFFLLTINSLMLFEIINTILETCLWAWITWFSGYMTLFLYFPESIFILCFLQMALYFLSFTGNQLEIDNRIHYLGDEACQSLSVVFIIIYTLKVKGRSLALSSVFAWFLALAAQKICLYGFRKREESRTIICM